MIRAVVVGAARILFNAAVLALTLSLLLVYASYRLARSSVAKDRGQPVREAGFAALVAVVALVQAVKAKAPAAVVEQAQEVAEGFTTEDAVTVLRDAVAYTHEEAAR